MSRGWTGKARADRAERREEQVGQRVRDISTELYGSTAGLRSGTVDVLNRVLAGERPEQMRVFAPERETVEQQFRRARENIVATTPNRGGQLNQLLADTDRARAQTLGGLEADVRRRAFDQALATGFQVPTLSLAGLGSAGGIFGNAATRSAGDVAAKKGGGAGAAGSIGGAAAAAAILA